MHVLSWPLAARFRIAFDDDSMIIIIAFPVRPVVSVALLRLAPTLHLLSLLLTPRLTRFLRVVLSHSTLMNVRACLLLLLVQLLRSLL